MSGRHRRGRPPGGPLGRLRALDDRVLPAAAARLRAVTASASAARGRARAAAAGHGQDGRGQEVLPAGGALARLDARLTRRGPLAVLRVLPGAGAAVAAVVALLGVLAAATVSTAPEEDRLVAAAAPQAPAASGSPEVPGAPGSSAAPAAPEVGGSERDPLLLGPEAGTPVDAHVAATEAALARAAAEAPDVVVPALVHLARPLTPVGVAQAAAGAVPSRAVVRVPLAGQQSAVTTVPALRLPDDLVVELTRLAGERRAAADADDAAAAATAEGDPIGDVLRESARVARLEADVLATGPDCACVVALLVTGTPVELLALPGRPDVLAVEPGPAGTAPERLALRPLLPAPPAADPAPPPTADPAPPPADVPAPPAPPSAEGAG